MIQVCVICMMKRVPLSPMEAEYKRLLEAVVSPFINTEALIPCHSYWLLCQRCQLSMQMVYNFQQTALVGVKNLKCLLHKLNTKTIEDTTPRVVTIKLEPPVSTPALKQEFITVEAPTNGNPLTEELHLKFERWPPESEHEPKLQDCDFDSTMSCDSITEAQNSTMSCDSNTEAQNSTMSCNSNTDAQNIQHPVSTAPSVQQVQIPNMDATAGSEGTFEVFTHKPQLSQKPCPSSIRRKDGVREGPRKRIRKKSRVACPHCGKSVLDTSLRTHINGKHSDSPCTCDVCGKQCRNQVALKSHANIHKKNAKTIDDTDPELFCQQCAVQFSSRHVYKQHLTTLKHIPRDQHQFECETCKKRFLEEARLQQHINVVHLGQKRHKCDKCDKRYGTARGVRRHIAVFHEKRAKLPKHVCHLCGKTFTIRNNLAEHLLSHEGLRPHQCPLCPATFTYKAALFTHNRLKHLKIKRKWKKTKKVAEEEGIPEDEKADSND